MTACVYMKRPEPGLPTKETGRVGRNWLRQRVDWERRELKERERLGMVVHIFNSSYSGGRGYLKQKCKTPSEQ
jgi:hypothetical protein